MQDKGQIQTLTQYLHETGAIICYRYEKRLDNRNALRDYVFTRPDWVTEYIYQILAKELNKPREGFAAGEFDLAHIRRATQGTRLDAELWQELMLAFELVFQIRKNDRKLLVAPQYLPEACTNQEALDLLLQNSNMPHGFTLNFPEFLPKSLFLRFIAKYGKHNKKYLYWESGLFFTHEFGKSVYATCDYPKRRIKVAVQGGNAEVAHDVFKFFLDELDAHTQISLEEEASHWVGVRELRAKHEQQGQEVVTACGKHTLPVSDFAFLFGQLPPSPHQPSAPAKARAQGAVIFTAFANPKQDLKNLMDEQNGIQDVLSPLAANKQIQHLSRTNTNKEAYFNFLHTWQNQITIFHFGGHAGADGIQLQDEYVAFESLARELVERNKKSLRLVFLNGCSTKAHVQTLFDLGVQTVIATSVDVQDDLACKFAKRFYKNIAGGDNVKSAYDSAYNFAKEEVQPNNPRFRFGGDPSHWLDAASHIQANTPVEEFPWGLYHGGDKKVLEYRLF